jgi:hypothetical protein
MQHASNLDIIYHIFRQRMRVKYGLDLKKKKKKLKFS